MPISQLSRARLFQGEIKREVWGGTLPTTCPLWSHVCSVRCRTRRNLRFRLRPFLRHPAPPPKPRAGPAEALLQGVAGSRAPSRAVLALSTRCRPRFGPQSPHGRGGQALCPRDFCVLCRVPARALPLGRLTPSLTPAVSETLLGRSPPSSSEHSRGLASQPRTVFRTSFQICAKSITFSGPCVSCYTSHPPGRLRKRLRRQHSSDGSWPSPSVRGEEVTLHSPPGS